MVIDAAGLGARALGDVAEPRQGIALAAEHMGGGIDNAASRYFGLPELPHGGTLIVRRGLAFAGVPGGRRRRECDILRSAGTSMGHGSRALPTSHVNVRNPSTSGRRRATGRIDAEPAA